MGDRRSPIRRRRLLAGVSAAGLGLVAGCMQPLLEEEPDAADDGDGPLADDDGGDGGGDGSSDDEGSVHVDDLELTEAWTVDVTNATLHVTALDGEFVVVNHIDENQTRVLGIDPNNGTITWESDSIDPDTHVPTLGSSVATDGQTVFVGTMGTQNEDDSASVHGVDRDDGSTQWSHVTEATGQEDRIRAVVALEDGVAYAADSDGSGDDQMPTIRRLDASGTEDWADQLEEGFVSGLEYYDGIVLFATTQGLHAYDATTGGRTDSFDYRPGFAGPARDESQLFLPSLDTLVRIDLETGDEVWAEPLERGVETRPVVDDGTIYLGGEGGYVLAYDRESGATQWEVRLDGTIASGPVLDGDVLWATDEGGDLYAVDVSDGLIVHHRTLETEFFSGELDLDVVDGVVLTEGSRTALRGS